MVMDMDQLRDLEKAQMVGHLLVLEEQDMVDMVQLVLKELRVVFPMVKFMNRLHWVVVAEIIGSMVVQVVGLFTF